MGGGAHLMIEKPLADRGGPGGSAALLRHARTQVLTAYNWRYWPPMQFAERLLREGRIGAVRAGRTEYAYHLSTRYPGQDYRRFYMADVKQGGGASSMRATRSTTCAGSSASGEVSAVVERVSSLEISTDDLADLTVRFASGAIGNIHMNLFAWNVHSHLEMMGEKGVIQWRRLENEIRVFDPTANRWEIYPFGGSSTTCTWKRRDISSRASAVKQVPAATAGTASRRCASSTRLGGPRPSVAGYESDDMTGTPYVFGVIPARGGSKGLPGKNLRVLGKLSLIGHAIASSRSPRG
jgi:predicted dehydrogenase